MERSGKINRKLGKSNTAYNVYSMEIVLKYKMVDYKNNIEKIMHQKNMYGIWNIKW